MSGRIQAPFKNSPGGNVRKFCAAAGSIQEDPVETVIGVFESRDRAETALKELIQKQVPQESIMFLSRSENEVVTLAKDLGGFAGGFVGGAAGLTASVVAATLFMIPGLGQVFALGVGATALLGLAGAKTGSALGKAVSNESELPQPTIDEEHTQLFRKLLQQGKSLIVVRTEWHEVAATASEILDRLGVATQERAPGRMQAVTRMSGDVAVVDIIGRITVGEGNLALRQLIGDLAAKGNHKVLLNLAQLDYVDSAGIGELVRSLTTLRKNGGQLKLLSPSKKVADMLQMTSLNSVFDIRTDEAAAVGSFSTLSAGA
jgi:anti-sigma B factor antagonist